MITTCRCMYFHRAHLYVCVYHLCPAPPPPEVEITAASTAIAGTALTLECSVSVVPHLTTPPHVEMTGPGEVVLASGTGLSLTHTLDPVLASDAGQQYVCKTVLEIESLGVSLESQSAAYTLTVLSKLNTPL